MDYGLFWAAPRVDLDVLLSIRMRVLSQADPPVATTLPAAHSADHKTELGVWLAAGSIAALIVAIYAAPFGVLANDWWNDRGGASYGLLIPPLVVYIAYARRAHTLSIPATKDTRGLALIFASCVLFLVGKLGAEYFITRLSLVTMLVGLCLTFWGAARTRTLGFPFLLLITMIPLPMLVYNRITLPLQLFSSEAATAIIQLVGGSVYRDGNVLHLANITLGVAEACSGLHSLASLVVAAVLLGFAECTTLRSRVVLVILAVPFAIAINVVRVTGTAFLAEINPDYAEGFYHAFSGWLVFLVGFGLTWAVAKGLHPLARPWRIAQPVRGFQHEARFCIDRGHDVDVGGDLDGVSIREQPRARDAKETVGKYSDEAGGLGWLASTGANGSGARAHNWPATSFVERTYQRAGTRKLGPCWTFLLRITQFNALAKACTHLPQDIRLPANGWEIIKYDSAEIPFDGHQERINKFTVQSGETKVCSRFTGTRAGIASSTTNTKAKAS